MGKVIADDEASYQYLAESIRMHPDQETLKQMMLNAGFNKAESSMTQGIVLAPRLEILTGSLCLLISLVFRSYWRKP
ncbi:hypothetical protein THIOSC15_2050017 [uncultured Thiomicrorhabdus sp.]